MNTDEIVKLDRDYVLPSYARYPIVLERGRGAYVYDVNGKEYLDFLSGISVCNLGHCNPRINDAIKDQLDKLIHCSNLYFTDNQGVLAKQLSNISFKGRTFFCNSGTEANEAAIKLMRYRGNGIREGKNIILSLLGSFHGRTSGSMAITGQDKHREGFDPILPGIEYIKLNDIEDLYAHFTSDVCGMVVESIQGESGVYPLKESFVLEARRLCNKYDALLIFDEVQTGLGRTGKYFGYEYYNIRPDGYTLAKSLANGLPIGAFHIDDKFKDCLPLGKHGSTFGANPLVTRAGIEVINILTSGLLDNISYSSELLFKVLKSLMAEYPIIKEFRIRGLMIAIEFSISSKVVLEGCHDSGLLCNSIGDNILRLLPPLIITDKEVNLFRDKMVSVLSSLGSA